MAGSDIVRSSARDDQTAFNIREWAGRRKQKLVFADGERILMPPGEPCRPWRTAATWYIWRALEDGNAVSTQP